MIDNRTPKEVFLDEIPEVNHLSIFGCPVYMHVPKDKRSKLDPMGKRGTFVGYSETSKAYRIYVPGFKKIEIGIDITFDEDAAFCKSKKNSLEEIQEEEPKAPRGLEPEDEEVVHEDHDELEPQRPEDPPKEVTLGKRRVAWERELMQEAKKYDAPNGMFKESKKLNLILMWHYFQI